MSEEKKQDNINKALFVNLLMMLGASAMQQLGKTVNPLTGKAEINLEGAQMTIDMIAMLKERTKGNLDKEEEKLVTDLLTSLEWNYVETSSSAGAQESVADRTGPANADEPPPADAPPKPDAAPKFHKSYG